MTTIAPDNGRPIAPRSGALRPLGIDDVTITGGFWGERQELNASVMIAHAQDWMEREGWIANFDLAVRGGLPQGRRGREFSDSDVYKLMEAIAWEHGRTGSADMNARFEALAARILPVQEPGGYLNTMFGRPGQQPRYSDFEWGHELYCLGHLIQAAVARARTAGRDAFVDAAVRAADHVCAEFGESGRDKVPGHPEIEVALAELGRVTGDEKYTRQASLFIDRRGHGRLADIEWGRSYYQDDVPVRDAEVSRGHAVRAMYLAAGAADVAVDLDDRELLDAIIGQARRTFARRTYVTGGMGSRHTGEAFGEDFELPPDRSYSETCAGIGAIMLSQRLLLATGEADYADMVERILYNIVATSPAEDGHGFFYANTLYRRTVGDVPPADIASPRADSSLRAPWYHVSCCPTNVARTLASLSSLVATTAGDTLQVEQYMPGRIVAELPAGRVELHVETGYPHEGTIRFTVVNAPDRWRLALRIPAWAAGATIDHGSRTFPAEPGHVLLPASPAVGDTVELTLPLQPRFLHPDPRIDTVTGQVAVARGPLVHALESVDLGCDVSRAVIDPAAGIEERDGDIRVSVRILPEANAPWPYRPGSPDSEPVEKRLVRLTPYHAWGNRGPATMRVWLPAVQG
ncbi:glycoside hydrolase family 127 protein [Tessaracoccus lapidicaptus]|uniref:glycoside hydrolase family 127 protein n=1 Tax=Tessaracoccus lapidicaptus TaxID=1427523 RepID=UPI00333F7CE9